MIYAFLVEIEDWHIDLVETVCLRLDFDVRTCKKGLGSQMNNDSFIGKEEKRIE